MSVRAGPLAALGLAIACGATAVACAGVLVVELTARSHPPTLFELAALLIAAAYGPVGCWVVVNRPANSVGWLLLAIAVVTAFTLAADLAAAAHGPGWQLEAWLQEWSFYLVYPVAFSMVLLVFPTGRVPTGRVPTGRVPFGGWRWVPAALLAAELPRLLLAAFAPGPLTGHMSGVEIAPVNPVALGPSGLLESSAGDLAVALSWALPALGLAAAAASLAARWRASKGGARDQLKWLALVAVLAAVAFGLHFLTSAVFGSGLVDAGGLGLVALLSLGIPAAIAVAVVRHDLFDVDTLLNRLIAYGLLSAVLVVLYGAVVVGLDAFLSRRLTLLGSLAATAVVAVAFAPVREQTQRGVDRWLFGRRPDPYEALAEVSLEITRGQGGRPLLDEVGSAIALSLGVSYCRIVAEGRDGETVAAGGSGQPSGRVVTMSLRYRGTPVGTMRLTSPPRWPRSARHRRLRADLAGQAAVAAHSVIQSIELERSRRRLLAARDEERRRLRRDLHDGLGPALAAQTLKAGAARMAIPGDLARAGALLQEIERDGQGTMAEVRRLVHALRPPALDELGLVGALREVAASLGGGRLRMVLDLPDRLPPLSAEVEAATLRIAQEALANVQRHAGAGECRLSLAVDGELRLTVEDDGVGPESAGSGVGLTSIRERAAELGGFATVGSRASSGTVVDVHIPLPPGGLP